MIESMTNKRIVNINKLSKKKYRQIDRKFIVEGFHLVEEAKKSGALIEVLSTEEYEFENVTLVSSEIIDKLSNSVTPQKIIGVCEMTQTSVESDRVLILDDISDPGNLGTLIRSAVAFGFNKIIVSNDTCDIYNAKVLRGTQGALFYAEIIKGDIVEEINKLQGYRVIGTSLEGSILGNQEIK